MEKRKKILEKKKNIVRKSERKIKTLIRFHSQQSGFGSRVSQIFQYSDHIFSNFDRVCFNFFRLYRNFLSQLVFPVSENLVFYQLTSQNFYIKDFMITWAKWWPHIMENVLFDRKFAKWFQNMPARFGVCFSSMYKICVQCHCPTPGGFIDCWQIWHGVMRKKGIFSKRLEFLCLNIER